MARPSRHPDIRLGHTESDFGDLGNPPQRLIPIGRRSSAGAQRRLFDGRNVTYRFEEVDTHMLAYAATIHKCQGSEYRAVAISVLTLRQGNMLYTGITRGKRLVVIVGQKKVVAIAMKIMCGQRRWSKLDEWLGRPPADDRPPHGMIPRSAAGRAENRR